MLRPNTLALTALLALLTAFGPVATDMYLPSLPDIGRLLDASPAEVQFTLSIFLIGFAVGQIFYGPASDRYGRKPIMLGSLCLLCAASLVCAAAPNIEWLIGSRAFQALGASGSIVIARAIVRDLYTGARAGRELSIMGAIMSIAPILAPIVGSFMHYAFGWRAIFLVTFGVGMIATVLVWYKLPETLPERPSGPMSLTGMLKGYREIVSDRMFQLHLGIVASSFAGLFAWISASSFVLQDLYGLSPFEFALMFTSGGVGYMLGTALAARLVTRLGLLRTIGYGAFGLAIGGLMMVGGLLIGLGWVYSLAVPIFIYLVGLGLALPQAMAGALMPFPGRAGTASSVLGFVQQSSAAILGVLVGLQLGSSAWPLAIPIAAAGCVTFVLWLILREFYPQPT